MQQMTRQLFWRKKLRTRPDLFRTVFAPSDDPFCVSMDFYIYRLPI